jgi:hypothetical protein
MTPNQIKILLDVYALSTIKLETASSRKDASWLETEDLIQEVEHVNEEDTYVYARTERGIAYVNALCRIPLPELVCTWVIPNESEP